MYANTQLELVSIDLNMQGSKHAGADVEGDRAFSIRGSSCFFANFSGHDITINP